jgi:hypothetical protein
MQTSLSFSSLGSRKRPRLETPALASQTQTIEEIQSNSPKSDSGFSPTDSVSPSPKKQKIAKKVKKEVLKVEEVLDDEDESLDEPSGVSTSRYAKKGTKSMLNMLSKFTIGKLQDFAQNRLLRGRRLEYQGDLTLALVTANPHTRYPHLIMTIMLLGKVRSTTPRI